MYSLYKMSSITKGSDNAPTVSESLSLDEMNIIRELSGNGPAVFVGRTAAFALKDRSDVLKVFYVRPIPIWRSFLWMMDQLINLAIFVIFTLEKTIE